VEDALTQLALVVLRRLRFGVSQRSDDL